jgi:cytidyltransferase-like protein
MRIYCDGIFDLFHKGHLEHFKKIHQYFKKPIHLIVGIISDKVAINYKRKPVFNENKRLKIIESILYVNETFITDTLVLDEKFFDEYKIDYIVHAFNVPSDKNKQTTFFEYAIKANKFIEIDYNVGTSTTKIIESYYGTEMIKKHEKNLKWNEIWENKGIEDTADLYTLNGWENTIFDPHKLITNIINTLYINKDEKILEIGCGAGLLSTFLKDYDYFGLDYSITLVSKHIQLLENIVINFSCTDIIFKDNYFDYVIINSTLEYLNSNEELDKTISEIERITKKGIYIANIRHKTRTNKIDKHKYDGEFSHFIINKEYFSKLGYKILNSLYDEDRYDVYKQIT